MKPVDAQRQPFTSHTLGLHTAWPHFLLQALSLVMFPNEGSEEAALTEDKNPAYQCGPGTG